MPDIAMCQNGACPLRMGCYRFRALPNEPAQTYAEFQFRVRGTKATCDHFLALRNGQRVDDDQAGVQRSWHKRWEHLYDD